MNRIRLTIFAGIVLAAITALFVLSRTPENAPADLGVTFSIAYAKQLGLDWRQAYEATLQDLDINRVRIPVYWWDVQPEQGVWNWGDYDWMLDQAAAHGARVTLVVGAKVPRWPECYIPEWALLSSVRQDWQTKMVEETVLRYRAHPALERWQVENEAVFPFGECPPPDIEQLQREIDLVHALDNRPVQLTVSGEMESWAGSAISADVLGVSVYRKTWNPIFGYFVYPLPSFFYQVRMWGVSHLVKTTVISELQAEPWFPEAVDAQTSVSWYDAFTAEELRNNVAFAEKTGAREVYLWGVEWWYYLAQNGDTRLWDTARELFNSDASGV